jgi:hypothetical protein
LVGIKKVTLLPGEKKEITFHMKIAEPAYYNENMEFAMGPETLNIVISENADSVPEKKTVRIIGPKTDMMGRRSYTCETSAENV